MCFEAWRFGRRRASESRTVALRGTAAVRTRMCESKANDFQRTCESRANDLQCIRHGIKMKNHDKPWSSLISCQTSQQCYSTAKASKIKHRLTTALSETTTLMIKSAKGESRERQEPREEVRIEIGGRGRGRGRGRR